MTGAEEVELTMTTLILPGLNGSGPDHWQSWWLRTQEDARLVEQADWDNPSLDRWSERVAEAVRAAPGAVLVGHSLACSLIVHIARRRPDLEIGGALLVAPADIEDGDWTSPRVAAFGPMPLHSLRFPAIVVASRDDPYVAFERARGFADAWGARFVDLGESGHINALSGFGPWPEGVELAASLAAGPPAHDTASAPTIRERPALGCPV
jgi:predicted alpha/beta hydrolase family esterase